MVDRKICAICLKNDITCNMFRCSDVLNDQLFFKHKNNVHLLHREEMCLQSGISQWPFVEEYFDQRRPDNTICGNTFRQLISFYLY